MAVSTWGGTSAFIAEGLRRAEEEKKRKEEEERRKAEEARRRSIIPPIRLGDENLNLKNLPMGPPTREEANRGYGPSIKPPDPSPLAGITNPYKISTEPPQIGASQPTAQTVMSAPQQTTQGPVAEPEVKKVTATQNPYRQQLNSLAAINAVAPTALAQPQLPRVLPQLGQYIGPAVNAVGQNLDQVPGALMDMWSGVSKAALDIPIIGDKASDMADSFSSFLPKQMQRVVLDDQREQQMLEHDAMMKSGTLDRWKQATNPITGPADAIIERYRYNLIDAPVDATDKLLKQFAPVVYGAMKIVEGVGALDEIGPAMPGTGILWGRPNKSAGEMWAINMRAAEIHQQQYNAYLAQQDDGRPWWELNPLQGGPNKKAVSPPDMLAAIALAEDEMAAALAPTALQKKTSSPAAIAAAISYTRSMAHHGIPAMAQMFDDILDIGIRSTSLRDEAMMMYNRASSVPVGPEREQLLFAAATLGAQAQQLAYTHPAQLYDKNANYWMALPAEMIFGITNIWDIGMDLASLGPQARRAARAAKVADMTVEDAAKAMKTGKGIGASWEAQVKEGADNLAAAVPLLRNFWQVASSRAGVDARANWRTITSLIKDFPEKEDIVKIVTAYANDAMGLLVNGIPASELKSKAAQVAHPGAEQLIGPQQDIVRFGPGIFGNYEAVNAAAALKPIADEFAKLPSLQGTGKIDPVQFASEVYTLLIRGAGEEHGVATLAGVPVGTSKAATQLVGDGTAIVQYLSQGGKVLEETAAMGLINANKMVAEINGNLKAGQEYATNYIQAFDNAQRSAMGLLTVNANFDNLVNDGISSRVAATVDGVWSWKGFDRSLAYLQGINNSLIPYDEVMRATTPDMTTPGGISSQFNQGMFDAVAKIPLVGGIPKWMQGLRQADDKRMRTVVYASQHENFMTSAGWNRLVPAVEQTLKDWGWSDPKATRDAATAVFDAGMKGGWQAAAQTFYDIANGTMPASAATIAPHYREIYGTFADELDNLVKSVKPENINEILAGVEDVRRRAAEAIGTLTSEYVSSPGRTYYTRLDDQKELTNLQTSFEKIAREIGEDYANGVDPYVRNVGSIFNAISADVMQVLQMAGNNPDAALYVHKLWKDIMDLRATTRTMVDKIGDDLLTFPYGTAADQRRRTYLEWRQAQEIQYKAMVNSANALIDQARQAIASGVPFNRNGTPFGGSGTFGLEALGYNPQDVFDINRRGPADYRYDPNANAAEAAGRRGSDMFFTQMTTLLQANFTQSGFDHFMSALDDVSKYWSQIIPAMKAEQDKMAIAVRALEAAGKTNGKTIAKKWDEVRKVGDDGWVKYYDWAYNRMQAASVLIAQAAGGITQFPTFAPTGNYAVPGWGPNPVLTMQGFNIRNPKEIIVVTPQGNRTAVPIMHVPPDVIKQWNDLAANFYSVLAGQVNQQAQNLFKNGTGAAEIDTLIANIRNATKNKIFDAVRKDMASYIANPQGHGDLGSSVGAFVGGQINQIAGNITGALPGIAQSNVTKNPPLPLDAVRQFGTNIKPIWDNIMAGATQVAEDMVSFSLVDFVRVYGLDVMLGAAVPYSYWATRQGKNMLERLLFSPRMFGLVAMANKVIQGEARASGQPQRYNDSINTGIDIPTMNLFGNELFGGQENLQISNPIPRWAPFGLSFIFGGWGDADRANQGHEYMLNLMESSGFPGWGDPVALWAMAMEDPALLGQAAAAQAMKTSEIAAAMGFTRYPWIQDAILYMNGRGGEINLSTYGYVGQIVNDTVGGVMGRYMPYVQSHTNPYVVGRGVSNESFGIDESASPINSALQADFEGRELAPEFQRDYPQAEAQAQQAYKVQFLEQLVMDILGFFVPVGISAMDVQEPARLAAQEFHSDMAFSPDNPTGGKIRNERLDETSPHYIPGLAAGLGTYQIINEGPQREAITPSPSGYPFVPPYETKNMDEGVILDDFLDKRTAIFDKYNAEKVAKINANPEWHGDLANPERSEWSQDFYDRQAAEIEALEAQYPTVANKINEPNEASLRGANPLETTQAALERLYRKAEETHANLDPGLYPRDGTREQVNNWHQQKDAYDAAVAATMKEYLSDPANASQAVFGRPLNATGPVAEQPAPKVGPADVDGSPAGQAALGQQQGAATTATAMASNTGTTPGVDPNNQWATQMAEAEKTYGLPPGILQEVARNESSFRPDAVSGAGAQGLMQVMPATWEEWAPKVGATDPMDPEDSIKVGAAYLGWLAKTLPGDNPSIYDIMVAYNWGIGNVLEKGADAAPPETKAYSSTIASAVSAPIDETVMSAPVSGKQMFIRPVAGGSELVSQGFGANVADYATWNGPHGHEGIDYGVPVGTPVLASADGTVTFAGTGNGFENYGNYIVVDHGNGYKTYYAHLDGFDVEVGDTVTQGQPIAASGNTGRSGGPHLHFALRKEGDTSGPYEMVNPTDFILGRKGVEQIASAPSQSVVSDTHYTNGEGVSLTTESKPSAAKAGTINWGPGITTAEDAITQIENKYKSPEEIALSKSVEDAWTAAYDRLEKTYPGSKALFEEYRGVNDEDRPNWRNANPMIRALNLLVYNDKEWAQVEKQFGKGSVETWARIPRGENIGEAAGDYYRQFPDSFLTKAWIQGRPRPFDTDTEFQVEAGNPYDFGTDYQTAKDMFGEDIWNIVREYYTIPRYVRGEDNTAWIAFKEKYPQYDQWRAWWYALMGDNQLATNQGFGRGFSGGFDEFNPKQGEHPQYIQGVQAQRMQAPAYRRSSGSSSDWRRYYENSKLGIKNPGR